MMPEPTHLNGEIRVRTMTGEWDMHICPPRPETQCQVRANHQPQRCWATVKHRVQHVKSALVIGVCGTHRNALLSRGWRMAE